MKRIITLIADILKQREDLASESNGKTCQTLQPKNATGSFYTWLFAQLQEFYFELAQFLGWASEPWVGCTYVNMWRVYNEFSAQ